MAVSSTGSSTSSTALSGSGTLSSAGLGSGLDVTGIVSKLMAIERVPIDKIETKTLGIQTELTAYGTLKGALSSFQTAAQSLASRSAFTATKATVGDTSLLSASSSSTAAIGTYSVKVERLAQAQKLQSAGFAASTDTVGTGTLTFDFGTYATDGDGVTTFTANTSKKSATFTIPAGSGSLSAIASAINASRAGISATVLNNGTNYYLSFSSSDPGVANSLRITVDDDDGTDTDGSGLSQLAYNKTSGYTAGTQSYTAPASVVVAPDQVGSLAYTAGTSIDVQALFSNNQFDISVDGAAAVTVSLPDNTYTSANIVAEVQAAIDNNVDIGPNKVKVALDANNHLALSSVSTGASSGITLSLTPGNTGLSDLFGAVTEPAQNNKFMIAVDGGAAVTAVLAKGTTYTSTNIVAAVQAAADSALGLGKVKVSLDTSNQIVITSLSSGALSSVDLDTATGNTGLSALFGSSVNVLAAPRNMSATEPQDAKIIIDGLTIYKSTNTITDAIAGVTLNLTKESATATTLTVSNDNGSISSSVDSFVKAYNTLSSMLKEVLSFDPATGKTGALYSEGTVRSIQTQLKSTMSTMLTGLGVSSLSDVGVSFQRDGSLAFSSVKLQSALSDPNKDVAALFAGNDNVKGIASRLDSVLDGILGGLLSTRTQGLGQALSRYATQKAQLESRMSLIESRYRQQFTRLDTLVSSMNTTATYLTQQLSKLPGLTSNTK